ncbi:hypothetical protein DDQ68_01380 [Hymenobacter nivis]|uniref:Uncharacterized protein n=1 Tax=Hymenobacter nivis TaxID=1850093 RepID=A0A2Z3GIL6_9BACT|nr:hypothetical protein DDQ68_01380 [Hymenobacter nivis]
MALMDVHYSNRLNGLWLRWLTLGLAALLGTAGCGPARRLTVGRQGVHWAPRFREPITIVAVVQSRMIPDL